MLKRSRLYRCLNFPFSVPQLSNLWNRSAFSLLYLLKICRKLHIRTWKHCMVLSICRSVSEQDCSKIDYTWRRITDCSVFLCTTDDWRLPKSRVLTINCYSSQQLPLVVKRGPIVSGKKTKQYFQSFYTPLSKALYQQRRHTYIIVCKGYALFAKINWIISKSHWRDSYVCHPSHGMDCANYTAIPLSASKLP